MVSTGLAKDFIQAFESFRRMRKSWRIEMFHVWAELGKWLVRV